MIHLRLRETNNIRRVAKSPRLPMPESKVIRVNSWYSPVRDLGIFISIYQVRLLDYPTLII